MATRVLLQPGQIWTAASPSVPQRHIVDFPQGMVEFRLVSESPPTPDADPDEYVVTQSEFRRWIRETDATLTAQTEGKAAPGIELAKKVITLRRAFGMNQDALAAELGVSRSAVAALETGRTSSARKHIPRLAEIFQVPVELFVGGMSEHVVTMDLSHDERDLIELYRHLSPELKLGLQKYAERRARN